MPFATLPNVRLHYALEGPPSAPVIVFSNSLGATLAMWDRQAAAFSGRFRVLRYDTRGHGQSSAPPGPYNIAGLAGDVLSLLDSLKIDRVHFCGLSMGGQTGQWLALNAPHRLDKLVLCNTGAKIGAAENWNARIDAVNNAGMKEIARFVVARWFSPAFHEFHSEEVAPCLAALEAAVPAGYVSCCAAVRDYDVRDSVTGIRVPTLVVAGAHDTATPPSDGRYLAGQIPGARYVELEAGHLSCIEDAARFNAELSAFLAS